MRHSRKIMLERFADTKHFLLAHTSQHRQQAISVVKETTSSLFYDSKPLPRPFVMNRGWTPEKHLPV